MTDSPKEKPWRIESWDDFRRELEHMNPKSKLFKMIRSELEKRGYWRTTRGRWQKKR
jgi:hypothetical protein